MNFLRTSSPSSDWLLLLEIKNSNSVGIHSSHGHKSIIVRLLILVIDAEISIQLKLAQVHVIFILFWCFLFWSYRNEHTSFWIDLLFKGFKYAQITSFLLILRWDRLIFKSMRISFCNIGFRGCWFVNHSLLIRRRNLQNFIDQKVIINAILVVFLTERLS